MPGEAAGLRAEQAPLVRDPTTTCAHAIVVTRDRAQLRVASRQRGPASPNLLMAGLQVRLEPEVEFPGVGVHRHGGTPLDHCPAPAPPRGYR
jgi:hypothetical protein